MAAYPPTRAHYSHSGIFMLSRTRSLTAVCGLVVMLGAGVSSAACLAPTAPGTFPDGTTASLEEMVAGQKSVKEFVAQSDAYADCVMAETPKFDAKKQYSDKEKEALAAVQAAAQKKVDAADAEKAAVAERFNVQLRAYKAKAAAPKN